MSVLIILSLEMSCVLVQLVMKLIALCVDKYCFGDLFSKICFDVSKRILENGSLRRCLSTYSVVYFIAHCAWAWDISSGEIPGHSLCFTKFSKRDKEIVGDLSNE